MDGKLQGGGGGGGGGGHATAAADYEDLLEPGYHFCPTDSELIVYYLKPKIENRFARIYDVNIYDYHPKELAAKYTGCEDKCWYFLTPREPRYAKGKRPNRQTKDDGTWRASQRYTTVENSNGGVVGLKRSLAYFENRVNKTEWLMHEYTTTENKMSDCVLCKIYKKKTKKNERGIIIQDKNSTRNNYQQAEKNQQQDEQPSPIRRRISSSGENCQLLLPQEINEQQVQVDTTTSTLTAGSDHQPFPVAQVVDEDDEALIDELLAQLYKDDIAVDKNSKQSMEVPEDDGFDELEALLYQDDADQDEIDKNSKQSMEVSEDDGFDELLAQLYKDDIAVDKNSKQPMEVPEDDGFDELEALLYQDDADQDEIDN